jgi:hypothetical protein
MLTSMKKRRGSKKGSMRNKLLLVTALIVGLSSIAYAAYTQNLTINGTGTATGTWNVAITDIDLVDSDGATENSAPTFNATSATFDVDLEYPGAFAEYDVEVTNAGNIPAILDTITDLTSKNAEAPTYITYAVSGVTADVTTIGTNTGVDDTNIITVRVEWDANSAPNTGSGNSKAATITFNYDQNT